MKTAQYQLVPDIKGETAEDTRLLRSMADEALSYLNNFSWCPRVKNLYLAFGIGGVLGIYLAELEKKIHNKDEFMWVIVGDLPTAYLVTDSTTPRDALETYISMMEDWARAVETGGILADVFPVAAKPTHENASMLRRRLLFLETNILAYLY